MHDSLRVYFRSEIFGCVYFRSEIFGCVYFRSEIFGCVYFRSEIFGCVYFRSEIFGCVYVCDKQPVSICEIKIVIGEPFVKFCTLEILTI